MGEVIFPDGQVFYRSKDLGNHVIIQLGLDEKTPKEASTIFHNIIKASVSPKATSSKVDKKEVKPKGKK